MVNVEKETLESIRLAGTEAAKPLIGCLKFIPDVKPFKNLGIEVLEDGSGSVNFDPNDHPGINRDNGFLTIEDPHYGILIRLPQRQNPICIRRTLVKVEKHKELYENIPAFEITFPDYDEEGDPEIKTFIVGALTPSLTLPGIGVFLAN